MNRRNNGMPRRSVRLEHGHNNREVYRNDNYFNDLYTSNSRTIRDRSNICPKGYVMNRGGNCVEMGGGAGPVGAFAEYCMEAQQNYMQCATAGGPGACTGSGYGDCNCQTITLGGGVTQGPGGGPQLPYVPGMGNIYPDQFVYPTTEICMCTPGPTLMNELQTACRRMGGSGTIPGPGGGIGSGRYGGSGRYRRGGRVRRRR